MTGLVGALRAGVEQHEARVAARVERGGDVGDVGLERETGADPGFVLLDARSQRSYEAGHLPGARLLARPFAEADLAALGDALLVVYCWGPACNGATKAARELAALGRPVKEMIGGFEYWERDGHAVERAKMSTFS